MLGPVQLETNQPLLRNTKKGVLILAALSWPEAAANLPCAQLAVRQVTVVTSGSAGWGFLSWPLLLPKVLLPRQSPVGFESGWAY